MSIFKNIIPTDQFSLMSVLGLLFNYVFGIIAKRKTFDGLIEVMHKLCDW